MEYNRNITVPQTRKNINNLERIISTAGGFYLLYDSLKNKRNILEIAAAGFMIFRGASGYCPASHAGKAFLEAKPKKRNINIHTRLIVKRPLEEVYNFWRDLDNLPLFMKHLHSVTILDETFSEWKAKIPGGLGTTLDWKAEIVHEEPYMSIGWQSLPNASIRNSGKVRFKDAGELGTFLHITISYITPMGEARERIAGLLNPMFEKMVREDILGFKRFMETGTPNKIQQETVKIIS